MFLCAQRLLDTRDRRWFVCCHKGKVHNRDAACRGRFGARVALAGIRVLVRGRHRMSERNTTVRYPITPEYILYYRNQSSLIPAPAEDVLAVVMVC